MNASFPSPNNEMSFLRTIRQALGCEDETVRNSTDFPHIFATSNHQELLHRLTSRDYITFTDLTATFIENAAPLKLEIHRVHSLSAASSVIGDIARSRTPEFGSAKHLIQHSHPDILELSLWQQFAGEPVSVHTTFQADPEIMPKTRASYIGVTVADWGIAESATLVQLTTAGMPRSTSLVPSIHIGLLRQSRLLANLTEAYAMLRQQANLPSITFITGPSKTADIEAHMVHGAHGPREMHVILYEDIIIEPEQTL